MADEVLRDDVTQITSVVGCDEDYYKNARDQSYDKYTLYLVNEGETVNDGTQAYSDLYYGQRKVSEVVIVNDYPGNPEYPDDKIYIRPYYGDEVWALPGGDEVAPTGYNVYFKHNGIVAPVETTMITEVNRDPQTSAVSITWRTNEGEYVTTQLLSVDAIYDVLRNLPEDVAESIASQVVVGDYEQTYQQLYDDIVVNHTKSPLGGMSWEPISQ